MILLQNPSIPVATNAVEIDAAIIDIQGHLDSGLAWLTNGYGRAYKNVDSTQGNTVYYPEVYLGTQNNSQRYTNISPDNDKQGQNFFFVTKETISQFQPGMYSFLTYDTAIIFSVNLELINSALLGTEIYQQILVAQVRDVLTRQLLGSSYQLKINSVDLLFDNVFSEFDLKDSEQLEKAPLSHFRFNCSITLPEACPTPTIIPAVTCKSLLLDGVNEYVEAAIDVAYDFERTDTFSLSAWVKMASLVGYQSIIRKKTSVSGTPGYMLAVSGDEIRLDLQNNGAINGLITITSGASLLIDTWYNITVTYSGNSDFSGVNVYLDSALQVNTITANTLTATIQNATNLTLGAPNYLNGNIASSRIWDVELSAADVLTEYNSGQILSTPVQSVSNVLQTDIKNAVWDGSKFDIVDLSTIANTLITINSEQVDLVEDCPS